MTLKDLPISQLRPLIEYVVAIAGIMLFGLASAPPASSASLFVSLTSYTFNGIPQGQGFNGAAWLSTTAVIRDSFDRVSVASNIEDLTILLQHDALWIDLRETSDALSPTEVTNLSAFIATGRRVVFVGENSYFSDWNQSFLDIVGGSMSDPSVGFATSVINDTTESGLLVDVSRVEVRSAGVLTSGGTKLFEPAIAAIWGPQLNVLGIFDSGLFADDYRGYAFIGLASNRNFRDNVVHWVAIPEPKAAMLILLGLSWLASASNRQRIHHFGE